MAGDNQQFCLRWNNHQSTLISVFDSLLESGTLVDCTLAAEGQYLKAHKVVLSACSPYLEALLSQHYEKHPIVILKDVKFQELKSMMDYMYRGEVNITQDQLATFLKAAESLQIKGLSESSGGDDARDVGSTAKRPREEPPPRRPVNPHPQARLPHSSGLTIEPRRSIPHSSEMAPESPMKSREGSTSPVARKRRRRRPSTGEDASNAALSDSQLETSNSCDLPPISNQAQSTPISVPSILATPSASNNQPIESDQPLETDAMNRFPNTPGGELMVKTKMEPNTDQLIEPKTEYLDDINNEDSVEDLTLDDDDEMPGPSHADGSNQNFSQWQMSGDRSTDEVFMAAQEAVGAHRDSQDEDDDGESGPEKSEFYSCGEFPSYLGSSGTRKKHQGQKERERNSQQSFDDTDQDIYQPTTSSFSSGQPSSKMPGNKRMLISFDTESSSNFDNLRALMPHKKKKTELIVESLIRSATQSAEDSEVGQAVSDESPGDEQSALSNVNRDSEKTHEEIFLDVDSEISFEDLKKSISQSVTLDSGHSDPLTSSALAEHGRKRDEVLSLLDISSPSTSHLCEDARPNEEFTLHPRAAIGCSKCGITTIEDYKKMIQSSMFGRGIMAFYERYGFLNKKHQQELVRIVVSNEFKELDTTIHRNRFLELREYIVKIFPSETVDVWYKLPPPGQKRPRGKLYDYYEGLRKRLIKSGAITSRRRARLDALNQDPNVS